MKVIRDRVLATEVPEMSQPAIGHSHNRDSAEVLVESESVPVEVEYGGVEFRVFDEDRQFVSVKIHSSALSLRYKVSTFSGSGHPLLVPLRYLAAEITKILLRP